MDKKGQLKLSFGMMFSILLIIIFIAFAIFGIGKFELQYSSFTQDLQHDIIQMARSSQGSNVVSYTLPSKVESICFVSGNKYQNLEYKPYGIHDGIFINNLNIIKTTGNSKSLCVKGNDGNFKFLIKKNWGEPLVIIAKA